MCLRCVVDVVCRGVLVFVVRSYSSLFVGVCCCLWLVVGVAVVVWCRFLTFVVLAVCWLLLCVAVVIVLMFVIVCCKMLLLVAVAVVVSYC